MKTKFSPKNNPRVIVIQKLYGKFFNNDEKLIYPKHRFKKFIKDIVSGTIERNDLILEELDKNKFSSNNFLEVNQQLEMVVDQIMSSRNINSEKTLSTDEQVFLENILSKIEKLETKILPKANLLNSFSQSIT